MTIIYALKCPISGEIRYIGKSSDPNRRLRSHVNEAVRNIRDHHTARWIRKLLALDKEPVIVELLCVPDDFSWEAIERFMIATARHLGLRITNSTAGGEGFDIISDEASRRWIAGIREANKRPDVIARKTEASRKQAKDPIVKAARSAGMKKRYEDKAQRSHDSARHAALWSDPVWAAKTREAIVAANQSPERAKRISEGLKKAHQDPDVLARRRRAQSPIANAKRSGSLSDSWSTTSVDAKARRLAGLARHREARRLESLRRIMEWDTV